MDHQLVILLVVGLITLGKWALKNFGGSEEISPPRTDANDPPEETIRAKPSSGGEEERMRKFMEALGVPAGSVPPARPLRRTAARRSVNPLGGPPQPVRTPVMTFQRQPEIPPPMPRPDAVVPLPVLTPVSVQALEPPTVLETVPKVEIPVRVGTSVPSGMEVWLRQPETLRRAIMAREILGPPRALQPI